MGTDPLMYSHPVLPCVSSRRPALGESHQLPRASWPRPHRPALTSTRPAQPHRLPANVRDVDPRARDALAGAIALHDVLVPLVLRCVRDRFELVASLRAAPEWSLAAADAPVSGRRAQH